MSQKILSLLLGAMMLSACASKPELPAADAPVAAYRCVDGQRFTVTFEADERAVVRSEGGDTQTLSQRRAASGFWYANRRSELRGKGTEATWVNNRAPQTTCRAS